MPKEKDVYSDNLAVKFIATIALLMLLLNGCATSKISAVVEFSNAPLIDCFARKNIGMIGSHGVCKGLLIVDRTMLDAAIADESYKLIKDGVTYTFGDSANNIFTGQVTTMIGLFEGTNFNDDIGYWDTRNVTSMRYMFKSNKVFNQNVGGWNTAKVTNLAYIFAETDAFNQKIGDWDTAQVVDMGDMFYNAIGFNQDISRWDTRKVRNMSLMFYNATMFNQNIGSWDTGNVTTMYAMLNKASAFNQDISQWNTSKVTNMYYMFFRATAFNQDISAWDVSNVTTMEGMFHSAKAFNQNLSAWQVMYDISHADFDGEATAWRKPKPKFTQ